MSVHFHKAGEYDEEVYHIVCLNNAYLGGLMKKPTGLSSICFFAFAFVVLITVVAYAAGTPGTLDTRFNGVGYVTSHGAAGGAISHDYGYDVVSDAFGNTVVAGFGTNASGNIDMVLWR